MKKRIFLIFAAICLCVPVLGQLRSRYVWFGRRFYPRNTAVLALPRGLPEDAAALREFSNLQWLDLRGTGLKPETYRVLAAAIPQERILWELDFQGRRLDGRTRAVQVRHLTSNDVEALCSLPNLRRVDGKLCRDYPRLLRLARLKPECNVEYTVELGGVCYSSTETAPVPGKCSREAVERALHRLPHVLQMDLRQAEIPAQEARLLSRHHPKIEFTWTERLGDITFSTDAVELDISGTPLSDTAPIEDLLPNLPRLQKLIACDCGLDSETMADLGRRYPHIRFVWRVKLGPLSARTDDTWFAPITKHQLIGGHDVDELKYCTDMECIDLGHCWIDNCEWARDMKNLRYLVLADTKVRDLSPLAGLKKLAYLELFVTPVKDYSPLLGCTGLEDLNLGYTYGDPAPIAQMTWLKNLWWGGIHHVPWYGGKNPAALLRQALPDTKLMFYAGSSTGLGWRELPHYYEMRDKIGMYYMRG